MPAPKDLAIRIVLRSRSQVAEYPDLVRSNARRNHQAAHFMGPSPASIVGIVEGNAGNGRARWATNFWTHQIEHLPACASMTGRRTRARRPPLSLASCDGRPGQRPDITDVVVRLRNRHQRLVGACSSASRVGEVGLARRRVLRVRNHQLHFHVAAQRRCFPHRRSGNEQVRDLVRSGINLNVDRGVGLAHGIEYAGPNL